MSAVGDELVIAHPTDVLPAVEVAVLVVGPALYLIGHGLFRLRMAGTISWKRLGGAVACLAVGALGSFAPALVLAALLVAILVIVIVAEHAASWRRRRRGEPSPMQRLDASDSLVGGNDDRAGGPIRAVTVPRGRRRHDPPPPQPPPRRCARRGRARRGRAGRCRPACERRHELHADVVWGTNRADLAAQVVSLINQYRASMGLSQLAVSSTLTASSTWKSLHMAAYGYFAHDDPAPPVARSAYQRAKDCGFAGTYWGENIAWGYTTAQSVVNGWLGSSGHKANIENPNFTSTGCRRRRERERAADWTQNFGNDVSGGTTTPPPPATSDTQKPSQPTGLTTGTVGQTSAQLRWTASTDNVGVTRLRDLRRRHARRHRDRHVGDGVGPAVREELPDGRRCRRRGRKPLRDHDDHGVHCRVQQRWDRHGRADGAHGYHGHLRRPHLGGAPLERVVRQRRRDGLPPVARLDAPRHDTSTAVTFTGLACGRTYQFGIEARDAAGNVSGRTLVTVATRRCW